MLNTFVLMTAEINSKTRADWRTCFHAGADNQNWEKKFALYELIDHMGVRLNVVKSSEKVLQDSQSWKELLYRLVNSPKLLYLFYNTGCFQYVQENFPHISEGNFQMCSKFYILGVIFSVHNQLIKPSNNLHSP
jgi:hypothetical protein